MMISARNQLDVTISRVEKGAVNALVVLETAEQTQLYASITNNSAEAMGLASGEKVIAFFKASHVLVASGWAMGISARNKLEGTVVKLSKGAVNTEVLIILPGGEKIASIITNEAVSNLALREGEKVVAIIKATDVMIAK